MYNGADLWGNLSSLHLNLVLNLYAAIYICNLQQLRMPLRKSLKAILSCCKLQIVFKSQNKLAKAFRFKDCIPKELTSGVIYKFHCGFCNESYYGECVRHLNVRIGEHIGISPLTRKKVKPKGSAVSDHLLLCNHSPSFENFSVLTKENKSSCWNWKKVS